MSILNLTVYTWCPRVTQSLIRRLFCEYKGTGALKRKPLARRAQQEFHEYVPPPRSPPPPPKPINHYPKKPQFWILHGTPFQRKRDLIFTAGAIAILTVMLAISSVVDEIHPIMERVMPGLSSVSMDEQEMQKLETRAFYNYQGARNAGEETTAADIRELVSKQKFTPRTFRGRAVTDDEELRWNE